MCLLWRTLLLSRKVYDCCRDFLEGLEEAKWGLGVFYLFFHRENRNWVTWIWAHHELRKRICAWKWDQNLFHLRTPMSRIAQVHCNQKQIIRLIYTKRFAKWTLKMQLAGHTKSVLTLDQKLQSCQWAVSWNQMNRENLKYIDQTIHACFFSKQCVNLSFRPEIVACLICLLSFLVLVRMVRLRKDNYILHSCLLNHCLRSFVDWRRFCTPGHYMGFSSSYITR